MKKISCIITIVAIFLINHVLLAIKRISRDQTIAYAYAKADLAAENAHRIQSEKERLIRLILDEHGIDIDKEPKNIRNLLYSIGTTSVNVAYKSDTEKIKTIAGFQTTYAMLFEKYSGLYDALKDLMELK